MKIKIKNNNIINYKETKTKQNIIQNTKDLGMKRLIIILHFSKKKKNKKIQKNYKIKILQYNKH